MLIAERCLNQGQGPIPIAAFRPQANVADANTREVPPGLGGRFLNSPNSLLATLRRLRGLRLRLTLCRIDLPPGGALALNVMSALEDQALILGLAPNGAFVALFIRRPGLSDAEATAAVASRLRGALRRLSEGPAPESVKAAFVHRWADAMSDGVSFLSEVVSSPAGGLVDWLIPDEIPDVPA